MKRKINILCSLILIIGIIYLSYDVVSKVIFKVKREKIVENYLVKKEEIDNVVYSDIIGILEIPKINLKQAIYTMDSENNNVDKNVEILKESKMPDIEGSNLYLVGHSGNRKEAYFNDLDKLEINNEIYFYYYNKKYTYKVRDIYTEVKNGSIRVIKDNIQKIVLSTCSKNKGEQLVVIGTLEKGGDT